MSDITITNYTKVTRFRCFSTGLSTCLLPEASEPLCLGSMSIQRVPGTAIVAGYITEGTATRPGRVNLQVSAEIYDHIVTVFSASGDHAMSLSYERVTFAPTGIAVT
jgi:hypothetical protein